MTRKHPKKFKQIECSICFEEISMDVSTNCEHSFCGACITNYWFHQVLQKIQCPYCRTPITQLYMDFQLKQLNEDHKKIALKVLEYNYLFSGINISLKYFINFRQKIINLPFLIKRLLKIFFTPIGFFIIMQKVLKSFYLVFLLFYIISPLKIIPDVIEGLINVIQNKIGMIDDIFVLGIIILHISNIYYYHVSNRENNIETTIAQENQDFED